MARKKKMSMPPRSEWSKWTGKMLGQLLVKNFINDIRNEGDENAQPLISQEDFSELEEYIRNRDKYDIRNSNNYDAIGANDWLDYLRYKDLFNSLVETYNKALKESKSFYGGYYLYLQQLYQIQHTEEVLKSKQEVPLIMTDSQYRRLQEECEGLVMEQGESIYSLLFELLDYFLDNPGEAPKPVKELLGTARDEMVPDIPKKITGRAHNQINGRGYYLLTDGTRSDQVDQDTLWNNFCNTRNKYTSGDREADDQYYFDIEYRRTELLFKGADAVKIAYEEETGEEPTAADIEEILDLLDLAAYYTEDRGLLNLVDCNPPTSPTDVILFNILHKDYEASKIKWVYHDPPQTLTKFELLKDYALSAANDHKGFKTVRHLYKEFKANCPEIYKALLEYIKETIPAAQDLKANQHHKSFITWGELADLEVPTFTHLRERDNLNLGMRLKYKSPAIRNATLNRFLNEGISIIQAPRPEQLEDNGDYKESDPWPYLYGANLLFYEGTTQLQDVLYTARDLMMLPPARYFQTYNAILPFIGKMYGIEDIEDACIDTKIIEKQLKGLNLQLYRLYAEVEGTPDERRRKRKIIKDAFKPVSHEELEPNKETLSVILEKAKGKRGGIPLIDLDKIIAAALYEG